MGGKNGTEAGSFYGKAGRGWDYLWTEVEGEAVRSIACFFFLGTIERLDERTDELGKATFFFRPEIPRQTRLRFGSGPFKSQPSIFMFNIKSTDIKG